MRYAYALSVWLCLPGISASAATYDVTLKTAIEKRDIQICDTIDKPIDNGDYAYSPEQAKEMCRVGVTVSEGKPESCLKFENKRRYSADVTPRHQCLQLMAKATHRPEICEMIAPEEESTEESLYTARCKLISVFSARNCHPHNPEAEVRLFSDNCRMQAINDIHQCLEGFHTRELSKLMSDPDKCVLTVASNLRDISICAKLAVPDKRQDCEKTVRQWQQIDAQRQSNSPQIPPDLKAALTLKPARLISGRWKNNP